MNQPQQNLQQVEPYFISDHVSYKPCVDLNMYIYIKSQLEYAFIEIINSKKKQP